MARNAAWARVGADFGDFEDAVTHALGEQSTAPYCSTAGTCVHGIGGGKPYGIQDVRPRPSAVSLSTMGERWRRRR